MLGGHPPLARVIHLVICELKVTFLGTYHMSLSGDKGSEVLA